MKQKIQIDLIAGVEGDSLSIGKIGAGVFRRVAGPKPWGGGKIKQSWLVDPEELIEKLKQLVTK